MKTKSSRFQIHDDLTAPEGSVPILRGATSTGAQLPNFLGVLAESPAALRAYVRMRSELRHGVLEPATLERISVAVAARYGSVPGVELHVRGARRAGVGLDEIAAARAFTSADRRHAALLAMLEPLVGAEAIPAHLVEETREAGWSDEEIIEAIAYVALEQFSAMVNVAGDVPVDGSFEESRSLAA